MKTAISLPLAVLYLASYSIAFPVVNRDVSHFTRLIVFGDSFSDNGNGSWVVSVYAIHLGSNSNGCHRDGPVWNERVADALGLELVNIATGGATTNNGFVQGRTGPKSEIPVPSTAEQIASFLSWDAPRPGDVFVHWSGVNEILFNPNVTGSQTTSLINENIGILYRAGARNIVLGNYNDIDTFPGTYNVSDYQTDNVKSYMNDLSIGLRNIVGAYSAYANTALVETQTLFRKIAANPAEYRIDEKYVNPPTACLQGAYGSQERSLCSDPERHLFFDSYHPVKEVHAAIGKLVEDRIRALNSQR
ncbi:unnamed protein product [Clonostachys byssicola]|uniref:Uncharacterized protein n=1 Tax=Clonostachys byssicola TaxID=160290 RepID=A0A9N9Y5Z9_9HYPO|nr:unnamed protein product [Clonostachys byssicola]